MFSESYSLWGNFLLIPRSYQNLQVAESCAAKILALRLQDESNGFELVARCSFVSKV